MPSVTFGPFPFPEDTTKDEAKNRYQTRAYYERDTLIAVLTKIWPSHLMRHPADDVKWLERHSQTWIVCVHSPAGRLAWHISDDDVKHFEHLKVKSHEWIAADGAERYQRLATWNPKREPASVSFGRSGGKARASKLSQARRSEIARSAALTRWAGHTPTT